MTRILFLLIFSIIIPLNLFYAQNESLLTSTHIKNFSTNPLLIINPLNKLNSNYSSQSIVITHSSSQTVMIGNSIACATPDSGLHTDNNYWRAFDLDSFGISQDFNVTNVSIGVELAVSGSGSQPIICYLYSSSLPFPFAFPNFLTLIGTSTVYIPNQTGTIIDIPVTAQVPAGTELVVQIFTPDGRQLSNSFFIGSNNSGQTGPSYFSAPICEISLPTNLSDIGFSNMHIVMSVTGDEVIPVELISFTAQTNNGNVELNWSTATETNNQGFDVQRNSGEGYVSIGFISGFGTTTEIKNYSFIDKNAEAGNHSYRLKQIDLDGTFEYSNVIDIDISTPDEFGLAQNYPNPFNPSTKISWQSPVGSWHTLKVYDVLGNEVATLVDEYKPAGSYKVDFNNVETLHATSLPSGVYFYRLHAGDYLETKKMILIK